MRLIAYPDHKTTLKTIFFTIHVSLLSISRGDYEETISLTVYFLFFIGDVIEIAEQVDANWLRGRHKGQEGIFPSNYVSPAQNDDGHVQGKGA